MVFVNFILNLSPKITATMNTDSKTQSRNVSALIDFLKNGIGDLQEKTSLIMKVLGVKGDVEAIVDIVNNEGLLPLNFKDIFISILPFKEKYVASVVASGPDRISKIQQELKSKFPISPDDAEHMLFYIIEKKGSTTPLKMSEVSKIRDEFTSVPMDKVYGVGRSAKLADGEIQLIVILSKGK